MKPRLHWAEHLLPRQIASLLVLLIPLAGFAYGWWVSDRAGDRELFAFATGMTFGAITVAFNWYRSYRSRIQ